MGIELSDTEMVSIRVKFLWFGQWFMVTFQGSCLAFFLYVKHTDGLIDVTWRQSSVALISLFFFGFMNILKQVFIYPIFYLIVKKIDYSLKIERSYNNFILKNKLEFEIWRGWGKKYTSLPVFFSGCWLQRSNCDNSGVHYAMVAAFIPFQAWARRRWRSSKVKWADHYQSCDVFVHVRALPISTSFSQEWPFAFYKGILFETKFPGRIKNSQCLVSKKAWTD